MSKTQNKTESYGVIIDPETRQLAAMVYGEAGTKINADEMSAIASVLINQRDARGYDNMEDFAYGEPSFSFVVSDGNQRYQKFKKSSDEAILNNTAMCQAVAAAQNALAGGPDLSNGAYFWDGADIKTNYNHHFKVKKGIKFTDPSHNIYNIPDHLVPHIKYKYTRKMVNGKLVVTKTVLWRYDYVFQSTAGYGGTIFWKFNPDYVKYTHSKEYR